MSTLQEINVSICKVFGIDPSTTQSVTIALSCDDLPRVVIRSFCKTRLDVQRQMFTLQSIEDNEPWIDRRAREVSELVSTWFEDIKFELDYDFVSYERDVEDIFDCLGKANEEHRLQEMRRVWRTEFGQMIVGDS